MKLKLIPRMKSDGTLILSLNYSFRVIFYSIAIIIAGNLLIDDQPGSNLSPFIFILLFFIFGSYQDKWSFNPSSGKIERKHGLLFLFRKKVIPFDQLTGVHMSSFTKGGTQADQSLFNGKAIWGFRTKIISRLYLQTTDERGIDVEVTEERETKRLEKMGSMIASLCDIPFLEDL
ncbi:MAG: hypothetical protein MJE63_32610 [Proteobacteria bacterium]|nr:hypothetical protein [Pseudomonadota bacterium]